MDWGKLWELFHKAWGQCHESPEYDKKIWKDMQHMLQEYEEIKKKKETVIQNRRKGERRCV